MATHPSLHQTRIAYERARSAAASATTVAQETLLAYVSDAMAQGHSTRRIAEDLQISKSTVNRISLRLKVGVGSHLLEPWSTPEEYVATHNAAWVDVPEEQIVRAPFEVWPQADGTLKYAISGSLAIAAEPWLRTEKAGHKQAGRP